MSPFDEQDHGPRPGRPLLFVALALAHATSCYLLAILAWFAVFAGDDASERFFTALVQCLLFPIEPIASAVLGRSAVASGRWGVVVLGLSSLAWASFIVLVSPRIVARSRRRPGTALFMVAGAVALFCLATIPDWGSDVDRLRQRRLGLAASRGNVLGVRFWIALGANPQAPVFVCRNPRTCTALDAAIENEHLDVLRVLLDHGTYPGLDTLEEAVRTGHSTEAVRLLVEKGAPCRTFDRLGVPMLTYAITRHDPALAALLIRCGADPSAIGCYEGMSLPSVCVAEVVADPDMIDLLRRASSTSR